MRRVLRGRAPNCAFDRRRRRFQVIGFGKAADGATRPLGSDGPKESNKIVAQSTDERIGNVRELKESWFCREEATAEILSLI